MYIIESKLDVPPIARPLCHTHRPFTIPRQLRPSGSVRCDQSISPSCAAPRDENMGTVDMRLPSPPASRSKTVTDLSSDNLQHVFVTQNVI